MYRGFSPIFSETSKFQKFLASLEKVIVDYTFFSEPQMHYLVNRHLNCVYLSLKLKILTHLRPVWPQMFHQKNNRHILLVLLELFHAHGQMENLMCMAWDFRCAWPWKSHAHGHALFLSISHALLRISLLLRGKKKSELNFFFTKKLSFFQQITFL